MSNLRAFTPFAVSMLWLGAAQPAAAGAWTKPPGEGEAIVSGLYAQGDAVFDAREDEVPVDASKRGEASVYGEYGLAEGLTVIGRAEVKGRSGRTLGLDGGRFGDLALGARIRLWHGSGAVVSLEGVGRLSGDSRHDPDGVADVSLLAGYGFELGAWSAFLDAGLGYRFRPDRASDAFRGDVTVGVRPRPDWLVMAQSFNTVSLEQGPASRNPSEHKLALSAVYDVNADVSVQVGAIVTVAGREVLQEQGVFTAIWLRF